MRHINFWKIFFLWIVVSLFYLQPAESMPFEDFTIGYKEIGAKRGHVACQCGKLQKIREKDLDIKTASKLFREITKDKYFHEKIKEYAEIKEFEDCLHCNLTYINCPEDLCVKKVIMFSLKRNASQRKTNESKLPLNVTNEMKHHDLNLPVTSTNEIKNHVNQLNAHDEIPAGYVPEIVEIPIGGHKNHSRLRRFVGCSYPNAMETAAISCRIYPSSIKCSQRCAFGYTLDGGIQKDMHCSFKDNRWIPSGFKECLPFVDCRVTLSSGGSATCTTASVEKAPICKIECMHYEDKPAVPPALYRCKIDGTWEPALPFCAMPGSGLVLASPPRIKTQD